MTDKNSPTEEQKPKSRPTLSKTVDGSTSHSTTPNPNNDNNNNTNDIISPRNWRAQSNLPSNSKQPFDSANNRLATFQPTGSTTQPTQGNQSSQGVQGTQQSSQTITTSGNWSNISPRSSAKPGSSKSSSSLLINQFRKQDTPSPSPVNSPVSSPTIPHFKDDNNNNFNTNNSPIMQRAEDFLQTLKTSPSSSSSTEGGISGINSSGSGNNYNNGSTSTSPSLLPTSPTLSPTIQKEEFHLNLEPLKSPPATPPSGNSPNSQTLISSSNITINNINTTTSGGSSSSSGNNNAYHILSPPTSPTSYERQQQQQQQQPEKLERMGERTRTFTLFLTKTEIIKHRVDQLKAQMLIPHITQSPNFAQIMSLDLSNLQIQAFPQSLSSLSHLAKLDLSSNSLMYLSPDIASFPSLQELVLDYNELVVIPNEISSLTSLQRLHIYNNRLSHIPIALCSLPNLRRLFLGKNNLSFLPSDISRLTSLEWLSLDENNLTSLPTEIAALNSLSFLSIESNSLSSLPKEMAGMENLEFFSVVNNTSLLSLPETFSYFQKLKDLRSDSLFHLPKPLIDRRDGREILNYLEGIIARFDLTFNEKSHWELDQNSSKCFKCSASFSFTKRRHHCRLCGLIFCAKDCDLICEVPGILNPGRCCASCFALIDPLSPSNLYLQQQEKKLEKEKNRIIGFEDGDENLPLEDKISKIKEQLREITALIITEMNTKDGLIKLLSMVEGDLAADTKQQIEHSDLILEDLNQSVNTLRQILLSLTDNNSSSNNDSSSNSSLSNSSSDNNY